MRTTPTTAERSRTRHGSRALLAATAVVIGALVATAPPANAGQRTLFVRVSGNGDCSSPAAACGSIDTAFNMANGGDHIELAGGTYATQRVETGRQRSEGFSGNVVVEPAAGEGVTLKGFRPNVHHLTLRGITINGIVHTEGSVAVRNLRFEGVEFVNATAFLNRMQGGGVFDSTFRDGINRDALNVKDHAVDVVIARNRFMDYRHDPGAPNADIHVDCIQTFGVTRLTIESNTFRNCSQRALILQTATNYSNDGVLVINNVFGACNQSDNVCQTVKVPFQATGIISAQRRKPDAGTARNYTIVNNHIAGWAYVEDVPGLQFANNILDRFFHEVAGEEVCGRSSEWNNLVSSRGKCESLSASDRSMQDFWRGGDLGFGDAAVAPPTDFDGTARCGKPDVGAFELQCSPTSAWGRAAA